jgi:2-amino-4-hydroxy-6-hydroxymethyldihydropteridine diphosphokinase
MHYILGLGSNLDPIRHVPLMLRALLELTPTLQVGRIIETAPLAVDGPPFLNGVVSLISDRSPQQLKAYCSQIELALGRDRGDPASKVKSRTADLDILLVLAEQTSLLPAELLPSEPYVRPILLELLTYLGMTIDGAYEEPELPPGVELWLDGTAIGLVPCTISKKERA